MKNCGIYIVLLFLLTMGLSSCMDENRQVEYVFRNFLEKEEPAINKLLEDKELANWRIYAYGSDSAFVDYLNAVNDLYERTQNDNQLHSFEHYEGLFYDYIQNNRKFQFISRIRESGQIKDPVLKQQLDFYYFLYQEGSIHTEMQEVKKVSNQIMEEYKAVHAKKIKPVDEANYEQKKTKAESRKFKWAQRYKQGEELAEKIILRAKLQNQVAKELGYRNFQQYYIESSQINYDKLLQFYAHLEQATRQPYREIIETKQHKQALLSHHKDTLLRPWYYSGDQRQMEFYHSTIPQKIEELGLLNIMKKYFYNIGLPVDQIIENGDLDQREGKYPSAMMFRIGKDDIRVLGQITNTYYGLHELMHNFGHAVYETHVRDDIPLTISSPAMPLQEGVAMLFEELLTNPYWIHENLKIKLDTALKYMNEEVKRHMDLNMIRHNLMIFNFEKALYENPEADLNKVWKDLYASIKMMHYPADYSLPDWALHPHIAAEGCYYYAYQVGMVFLSQLRGAMQQNIPDFDPSFSNNLQIGEYLVENLFQYGHSLPMDSLIKMATGKSLSITDYVEPLAAGNTKNAPKALQIK